MRSADKTVVCGLVGLGTVRRRFVPRTLHCRMLFPVFCALWARPPFAFPLVCGRVDDSVAARLTGAEGSKSPKSGSSGLISTRGGSDMVRGGRFRAVCGRGKVFVEGVQCGVVQVTWRENKEVRGLTAFIQTG